MSEFDNIPMENLEGFINEDITSGISETNIYYIPVDHIEADVFPPKIGDLGFSLKTASVLTEDIVLKADRYFSKLRVQTETGEVKDSLGGNKGNKKGKSSFEFFLTDTSPEHISFVDIFKNVPLVMFAMDKQGRLRKIGSTISPAYFESGEGTTGKGPDDDAGFQIMVSTSNGRLALIYEGNIKLKGDDPTPTP
ncbi:hypothetical protein AWE51_00180 [Aquimarina aggregata]|uniref:Phage tail protein n=1 Tax=Aquimarina aggregata TaxID=1642818 RepID=A0A162DKR9_9FLAO|nr:hypothetical protein [Aquimarina aggregata]KZS41898.1 hypothetical protein AWE51_00180 [Aquimarina aggregata]